MTNNNNKQRLLNLFADNVNGEITAGTLREFIETIFDDSEVVINSFNSILAFENSTVDERADIYEGSLVTIENSTDDENGVYVSLMNQPSESKFLRQISNNSKVSESEVTYTEVLAQEGQFSFSAIYSKNLCEVFVDGIKRRHSRIQLNSTDTTLGTNVILLDPAKSGEVVEIKATVL